MSTSILTENTTQFLFHPAESQVPPAPSALEPIHLWISDKAQTALLHHKYLPILSVLGMHWALCLLPSESHKRSSRKFPFLLLNFLKTRRKTNKQNHQKGGENNVSPPPTAPSDSVPSCFSSSPAALAACSNTRLLQRLLQPYSHLLISTGTQQEWSATATKCNTGNSKEVQTQSFSHLGTRRGCPEKLDLPFLEEFQKETGRAYAQPNRTSKLTQLKLNDVQGSSWFSFPRFPVICKVPDSRHSFRPPKIPPLPDGTRSWAGPEATLAALTAVAKEQSFPTAAAGAATGSQSKKTQRSSCRRWKALGLTGCQTSRL